MQSRRSFLRAALGAMCAVAAGGVGALAKLNPLQCGYEAAYAHGYYRVDSIGFIELALEEAVGPENVDHESFDEARAYLAERV